MADEKKIPPEPAPDELDDPILKKLGSCCICGTHKKVRNIILLNRKCIVRGHGWGCCVCNLPRDGAVAVLCDTCMKLFEEGRAKIKLACKGYPMDEGRVPIESLTEVHEHNTKIHDLYEAEVRSLN